MSVSQPFQVDKWFFFLVCAICLLDTVKGIARFRYFKIQLETKDITTRLRGINLINLLYNSLKPRSDVFCFKLNFNISKLGYCELKVPVRSNF